MSAEVDAYLGSLVPSKRVALIAIRQAIRAAAPDATEGMSYGMPAFFMSEAIAGYAAGKDHCSYYPMSGAVIQAMAVELRRYKTSKGTIRFSVGEPLPAELVGKLVRARIGEIR